jgi:uncharacterized protein (TIGR02466 family)
MQSTTTSRIDTWFPKSVYVVDGVLVDQLAKLESDIKSLHDGHEITRTGMQQVNSLHKTFDEIHTRPELAPVVEQIQFHAAEYLTKIGYSMKQISKMVINNMWSNISHENDFVAPHHHSNSIISGAFYIKALPDSKLRFYNNPSMALSPDNFTELSYEYCLYDCIPGRLLLFKSDFMHGTDKQGPGEKIVVSFNISKELR